MNTEKKEQPTLEELLKPSDSDIPSKAEGEGKDDVFHDALEEVGGKIIDLAELDKQAQEE